MVFPICNRRHFLYGSAAAMLSLATRHSFGATTDPTRLGIAEAAQLIRAGELTPSELTASYLSRIGRLEPEIKAYITVLEHQALNRARALDIELAQGHWRGPLHGIPIALKDNIDTAGIRTTAGSAVFGNRIPVGDAEVVRRLNEAGAVILGKLNMYEFAFSELDTDGPFGFARNPWDRKRITGGSSSGSGAAVAARLCAGALGTDTGGSIRIPAATCGISGLMPTYGLVSTSGIIPFSTTLDHVGPMCRSVADTALMLQAIAGYDPRYPASIAVPIPDYTSALSDEFAELRLGLPQRHYFENIDSEILTAVEAAIGLLSELTATTIDVEMPPRPGLIVGSVEIYAHHQELLREKGHLFGASALENISRGAEYTAAEYAAAREEIAHARRAIKSVFEKVDLLVMPTLALFPATLEEAETTPQQFALIQNTIPFNNFGIPALTIPCGLSSEGLPIGLQICGPALGEPQMLALAHAYQQRTDWHRREPPVG